MYTLRLATEETRDLVVSALRSAADQRTRVARTAAGRVAEKKRTGKDVRSASVKVTTLLAEADSLAVLADDLAAADALPVVADTPVLDVAAIKEKLSGVTPETLAAAEGDGTSPRAQALAAAAGLTDAILEEDVDTGAIVEDEPDQIEEVAL